eukprot:gene1672-1037_t
MGNRMQPWQRVRVRPLPPPPALCDALHAVSFVIGLSLLNIIWILDDNISPPTECLASGIPHILLSQAFSLFLYLYCFPLQTDFKSIFLSLFFLLCLLTPIDIRNELELIVKSSLSLFTNSVAVIPQESYIRNKFLFVSSFFFLSAILIFIIIYYSAIKYNIRPLTIGTEALIATSPSSLRWRDYLHRIASLPLLLKEKERYISLLFRLRLGAHISNQEGACPRPP